MALDSSSHIGGARGRDEAVAAGYSDFLDLDLEDEDAIIAWCRRYGLLGILSQETVQLRLAPRWRRVRQTDSTGSRYILTPYEPIYFRSTQGWRMARESTRWSREMSYEGNEDLIGRLAEPRGGVLPDPPTALTTRLFSVGYESKPLGEAVGHFFPLVPPAEKDSYSYPYPLSDDFWREYSEPLVLFRWAARDFRDMMDNLSHAGPWYEQVPRARAAMVIGRDQLNSLLSVYPSLRIEEDGTMVAKWMFPSLLAAFTFEVWQSLIGGQSIRHCQRTRCHRLFVSAQYNREYCSDRCRQAEEKARQRRRNQTG